MGSCAFGDSGPHPLVLEGATSPRVLLVVPKTLQTSEDSDEAGTGHWANERA